MTTDLAIPDPQPPAVLVGLDSPSDALARLGDWVQAASHAHTLVAPLVNTAFVPDAYKVRVDPRATPEQKREAYDTAVANATAAVLQGISLGLDPMTALQQIYVVHGRPGMYTRIKVALVQSKGHEVWTEDLSDSRAVVCGRRKGSQNTERVTVTMEQARRAGWTRNEQYTKSPQDMLWARAAGRVCDRLAPEALMGIASVEEIRDELAPADTGTRTVTPTATRRRLTAAKEAAALASAPAPEPPLDGEPPLDESVSEPEPVIPPVDGITQPQQRKLHAMLREQFGTDRDAGLRTIAAILERPIESTKDLSKADAKRVIDELERPVVVDEPPLDGGWPEPAQIPDGA